MEMLLFLMTFPALIAVLVYVIRNDAARNVLVVAGAVVTAVASIALACMHLGTGLVLFECSSAVADAACTVVSCICVIVIVAFAVRHANALAGVLALVQIVVVLYVEFASAHDMEVSHGLYVDSLTIMMVLIIGIIGSGICVYALGYMKD